MSPPASFPVRTLLLLGLGLSLYSALCCVWEVLALQMPDSPLHVGVLAGPIAQLRNFSFGFGVGSLVLASVWSLLFGANESRWLMALWLAGALLHVAALSYAAARGMVGVQLLDPRLDARLLVYTRGLAHALTLAFLIAASVRALKNARSA